MTAQQGLRQRDAALAEVEAHYAPEVQAGLAVLAKWAKAGAPFSANDVRAELIAAGVHGPARGHAFRVAVKDGILRRLAADQWETSTDPGTHGKPLPRYVRAGVTVEHRRPEVVGVPVSRTSTGRFAATEFIPGQGDILDAIAEAQA